MNKKLIKFLTCESLLVHLDNYNNFNYSDWNINEETIISTPFDVGIVRTEKIIEDYGDRKVVRLITLIVNDFVHWVEFVTTHKEIKEGISLNY